MIATLYTGAGIVEIRTESAERGDKYQQGMYQVIRTSLKTIQRSPSNLVFRVWL